MKEKKKRERKKEKRYELCFFGILSFFFNCPALVAKKARNCSHFYMGLFFCIDFSYLLLSYTIEDIQVEIKKNKKRKK